MADEINLTYLEACRCRPGEMCRVGIDCEGSVAVESVLAEADRLTAEDRRDEYGDMRDEALRVAAGWQAILGHPVSREQVCLCMAWLKIAREAHRHKRDSIVDAAGYLKLAHYVAEGG